MSCSGGHSIVTLGTWVSSQVERHCWRGSIPETSKQRRRRANPSSRTTSRDIIAIVGFRDPSRDASRSRFAERNRRQASYSQLGSHYAPGALDPSASILQLLLHLRRSDAPRSIVSGGTDDWIRCSGCGLPYLWLTHEPRADANAGGHPQV